MNKHAREQRVNERKRAGFMRYVPGRKTGKWLAREAESTAIIAAPIAGLVTLFGNDFVEAVQESVRHGRHASHTVRDMVIGSPGERAAEDLDEFYDTMTKQGFTINETTGQIYEHIQERMDTVDQLNRQYDKNEAFMRQAERLVTQAEGAVIEGTAAGDAAANTLTRDWWGKLDDFFMDGVGSAKDARDNLPVLQEIVREARKMYDGKEKLDITVDNVAHVLRRDYELALTENTKVDQTLNEMAHALGTTYTVESSVFTTTGKISLLRQLIQDRGRLELGEVERLRSEVADYNSEVDHTRSTAESALPIGPYQRPDAWIDYSVNPLTIGLAAAVAVKGASYLTGPTRRGLTALTHVPVHLAKKGTVMAYNGIRNQMAKINERLKNLQGGDSE